MHNIGNDIVDLNLAKTQSNWQRKGFLEKQFTGLEQNCILSSANPFLQVWLFWSMKEAAYKCYTQAFQKRFFAPKKFACKMISKTEGTVTFGNYIYQIKSTISINYIHTLASEKNDLKMVSSLFYMDKNSCQTKTINTQIHRLFPYKIHLQKNDLGIPYLYQKNQKLPVAISKSHHGNYGGFAILFHS